MRVLHAKVSQAVRKESMGTRGKRLQCIIRNVVIGAVALSLSLLPFVRKLFV